MIVTIYQTLTAECTSVPRWFQYGHSGISTAQKPLGVIEVGPIRRQVGNRLAASREIVCAVYFSAVSWPTIEAAADEVKRILCGTEANPRVLQTAGGKRFTLEYSGTSGGFHDDTIQAWGMRVMLSAPLLT